MLSPYCALECLRMSSAWLCRGIALALCIQIAMASGITAFITSQDKIHETVVHGQAQSHHHHMDLSLHIEGDENHHWHAHHSDTLQVNAILPDPARQSLVGAGLDDLLSRDKRHSSVFLEGPLRPPQSHA
jgi:hypothetical protein